MRAASSFGKLQEVRTDYQILNGKRPVSIEYALYLEAVLGIDARLWIQMQADYNLQVAKSDRKINRHLLEIRKLVEAF